MKKSRVLVAATTLIALGLSGCATGGGDGPNTDGGDKKYNWDFTITVGESSTWYAGAEKFKEILESETDGRIKVNLFPNEELSGGDPAAGVEQLSNGDKAFSYNSPIIYSGIDPRFGAITAPFLYEDYAQADAAIAAGAKTAYEKLTDEMGIKMLGFGESGFRQLTNNKHEILSPADLVGMKIRVAGSALFMDIYKELGADPINMNFAEVFTSLQQGTIDGQENPYDVIYSNGIAEVQKYLSIVNYVYDPLILGMNKELFDSLSDADKTLVQKAADEANAFQVKLNRDRGDEQLAEFGKTMTVSELSSAQVEEFRKVLQALYQKYESIWTPEVFEAVKPK